MEVGKKKVDIPVRTYGKTGTSNNHTNSSFVGFIPAPKRRSEKLENDEGYVISCYVGYDDNRPMKAKNVTIYGASGALPVWIDTAKAIVNSNDFKLNWQPADTIPDFQTDSLSNSRGMVPVVISPLDGFPMMIHEEGKMPNNPLYVMADIEIRDNTIALERVFEPLSSVFNDIKSKN